MEFKSTHSKNDILVGLVVIFLVGAFVYLSHIERVGNVASVGITQQEAEERTDSTPVTFTQIAFDEVVQHDNENSCWTIIDGIVYDLTDWVARHPGGSEAILELCGEDGSDIFNRQHGGSSGATAQLESFSIGTLTE